MATGNTIQRARKAAQDYAKGGFSVELTLKPNYTSTVFVDGLGSPYVDGAGVMYTNTATPDLNGIKIQGLTTKHRQVYSPDTGLPIIGKNIHCLISEVELNQQGYATRNQQGNVIVKGWLVSWEDAIDQHQYIIEEPQPDETLGLIKCLLGEYA